MRILITGASGSGTTTLGRAAAAAFGAVFLDADDYFWLPTEPPFQARREPEVRLALLLADLAGVADAVIAGSVMNWGTVIEDSFSLIVFLTLAAEVRVERLRARETLRYGYADPAFLEWAAQYDEGLLAGRSRQRQERWLAGRTAPIIRIDGDRTVEQRLQYVVQAVRDNPIPPL